MSLTLGEKLRQAREARGISISQVAEQTRISALYLKSIEEDDYKILPGGIFNKGFVKSFAKTVGVDEQEALQDYAELIGAQDTPIEDQPKTYRPEVLTDERNTSSMLPTVIFAIIILGLMTWGILFALNYIQKTSQPANTSNNSTANANLQANKDLANANSSAQTAPTAKNFKVEFKALKSDVYLGSIVDGKTAAATLKPEQTSVFEPKESLHLSYSTAKIKNVQMTINGKPIALPSSNGNRNTIEFEIKQNEFQSVFDGGQIGENLLIKKK